MDSVINSKFFEIQISIGYINSKIIFGENDLGSKFKSVINSAQKGPLCDKVQFISPLTHAYRYCAFVFIPFLYVVPFPLKDT